MLPLLLLSFFYIFCQLFMFQSLVKRHWWGSDCSESFALCSNKCHIQIGSVWWIREELSRVSTRGVLALLLIEISHLLLCFAAVRHLVIVDQLDEAHHLSVVDHLGPIHPNGRPLAENPTSANIFCQKRADFAQDFLFCIDFFFYAIIPYGSISPGRENWSIGFGYLKSLFLPKSNIMSVPWS